MIRAISFMIIALDATTEVLVVYREVISKDRDFLFKSDCLQDFESTNSVFAHVTDFIISIIQVYNVTIVSMRISRKMRLRVLFEYEQNEVFLIKASKVSLAAENVKF